MSRRTMALLYSVPNGEYDEDEFMPDSEVVRERDGYMVREKYVQDATHSDRWSSEDGFFMLDRDFGSPENTHLQSIVYGWTN